MSIMDRLRQVTDRVMAASGMGTMITCEEALAVMQEFLDGELPPGDEDRVRAPFDVCKRCYPKLRLEGSFRSALQAAALGQTAPDKRKIRVRSLLDEVARG